VFGLGVDFRFIFAHPENFWGGEAGEGGVGDEVDELCAAAGFGFDLSALGGGALVVPKQCGAEGFGSVAEEDAAVHLAGEADGGNVGGFDLRFFQDGFGGGAGGLPPVFGVLFRPAGLGRTDGVLGHRGGEDGAVFIADEGLRAAGSDVDSEEIGHGEKYRRRSQDSEVGIQEGSTRCQMGIRFAWKQYEV
jgi:hypothetical protein